MNYKSEDQLPAGFLVGKPSKSGTADEQADTSCTELLGLSKGNGMELKSWYCKSISINYAVPLGTYMSPQNTHLENTCFQKVIGDDSNIKMTLTCIYSDAVTFHRFILSPSMCFFNSTFHWE